jgi:hypothetical protein
VSKSLCGSISDNGCTILHASLVPLASSADDRTIDHMNTLIATVVMCAMTGSAVPSVLAMAVEPLMWGLSTLLGGVAGYRFMRMRPTGAGTRNSAMPDNRCRNVNVASLSR